MNKIKKEKNKLKTLGAFSALMFLVPLSLVGLNSIDNKNNDLVNLSSNIVTFEEESIRLTGFTKEADLIKDEEVQFRVKSNGFDYQNLISKANYEITSIEEGFQDGHYFNTEKITVNLGNAKNFELVPIDYFVVKDGFDAAIEIQLSNVVDEEVSLWVKDDSEEFEKFDSEYKFVGTQFLDGGDISGIIVLSLVTVGFGGTVWWVVWSVKKTKGESK